MDLRIEEDVVLRDIAVAVDAATWSQSVDLVHARVPVVKGRCRESGVDFDVTRASDGVRTRVGKG